MNMIKRLVALLLCAAMISGMAGCAIGSDAARAAADPGAGVSGFSQADKITSPAPSDPALPDSGLVALPVDDSDRESLEQIVELVSGGSVTAGDAAELDDEALRDVIEDLLEETDPRPGTEDADTQAGIAGDGRFEEPFDQLYPGVMEEEAVEFDDETLLLKLDNSRGGEISAAMAAAGVAKLDAIVPMETATWYEASFPSGTDIQAAAEVLRGLPEILLVDFNYRVRTSAMAEYEEMPADWAGNPQAAEQWYLNYCGIPSGQTALTSPGGSASVIVAVIDTGVDYTHQDLAGNIWTNTAEIPDNGVDDDGNGYTDDYYGVNVITGTGSGGDDNGHGTHVAGIIAAKNNNLGTVGIAHNVRIMPIKAAMASGYLNQSDIARAILYAYEHGAEVINMSFGGSACSIAVQDALATAYTRCVLVASAGNDGSPNEPSGTMAGLPNYPAALSYVLGVMSVGRGGVESGFTNFDVRGYNAVEYELYAPGESIISTIPGDRYASWSGTSMAAPVVAAMAALLRGQYTDRDTYPTKFIYGQLAATSQDMVACGDPASHGLHNVPDTVNLYSALTAMPEPDVSVQDYAYFDTPGLDYDTAGANTGEGVIDAGETIALGLTLRNRWGMSRDTLVTIDTLSAAGMADPYITIHNPTVDYGSVGTYSTGDCGKIVTDDLQTGWEDPFYITVAADCPNDYVFRLNVTVTCGNALDAGDDTVYTAETAIDLRVRSGKILPSVIDEDMTLTRDNLYIIPNATVILEGVTVNVEPGTHIQFWSNEPGDPYAADYVAYLLVHGQFLVNGTAEDPVYIYPSDLMDRYVVEMAQSDTGWISLRHADITNFGYADSTNYENTGYGCAIGYAEDCTFRANYLSSIIARKVSGSGAYDMTNSWNELCWNILEAKNCAFYKIYLQAYGSYQGCIFADCGGRLGDTYSSAGVNFNTKISLRECVFLGNWAQDEKGDGKALSLGVNTPGVQSPSVSVLYRAESGSTYLVQSVSYTEKYKDLLEYVQMLGGGYLVLETAAETQWLAERYGSGYRLDCGIRYDPEQGCYTWYNGQPLTDTVADPQGLLSDGSQKPLCLYNGQLTIADRSSTGYRVYEIPGKPLPESIRLDRYEITIDPGAAYQLVPLAEPYPLAPADFRYASTDENVVTVDENGLITPVANGDADVYIYSEDRAVSNYITVHVRDCVALESMAFAAGEIDLALGETAQSGLTLNPADTTRIQVTYTSSDESVAAVDSTGVITGLASGTAVITARCEDLTAEMTVRVYRAAESVSLAGTAITGAPGECYPLPAVTVSEESDTDLSWQVLDPAVAELTDDGVRLLAPGYTALTITDRYTGLSAAVSIYVPDGDLPAIRQITGWYILLEDGRLFSAGSGSYREPVCILENVEAFCYESSAYSYMLAALKDGTVIEYNTDTNQIIRTYEQFRDLEPVEVYYDRSLNAVYNPMYLYAVRTASGDVYTWGSSNSYGTLGLGTTAAVTEPTRVALNEAVVRIAGIDDEVLAYQTASGNLFISGGTNLKAATPTLVARGAAHLSGGSSLLYFVSGGYMQTFRSYATEPAATAVPVGEFDTMSLNSKNYAAGIRDGKIYLLSAEGERVVYEQIENPVTLLMNEDFTDYPAVYAGTADGLYYGAGGILQDTTFWGLSHEPLGTKHPAPVLMPLIQNEEHLTLQGTNLSDGVLTGESLELVFNKELTAAGVTLYENGTALNTTLTRQRNVLTVSCAVGFAEGVEYQLVIHAASTTGKLATAPAEDLTVTFTYTAPAGQEAAGPVVVHTSVLDESVQRRMTADDIWTAMEEEMAAQNIYFRDNAVLSHLTTETDTAKWMQLRVPNAPNGDYMELPIPGNYWGTTNERLIGLQMTDYTDFITYYRLVYDPFLTEAPETVFPFVTGVTICDRDGQPVTTVGNEQITVRVTFNRDMDPTAPLLVRFGSTYPYGDYELEGSFTDSRTWEGTYTLNTLIENGSQRFTISGGRSADGRTLFTDRGRFGFTIDTTAAQALIMQGSATDTGIRLTWTQDDFDTLMGYNVYRAASEDGYYQRLNAAVIPADTMEFFDDTVEPGVVYYYNFTVVRTDLSESVPSGKISIMSKDTMAPDLYHTPVYSAFTGSNLIISATVTDNLSITGVLLYYRTAGETAWKTAVMNRLNDKYSAIIPADQLTTAGLEYYIEATDGVNVTRKGSPEVPYQVTVREAVSANAMGDVNGDGRISNLDALMLLQAINDLLNLDSQQFARADLNGDGQLAAAEALRILQYVSGTVGDLIMP